MLRSTRIFSLINKHSVSHFQKQTYLTSEYKCSDAWNIQRSSAILSKVNLNDFYNLLDQNYTTKGVISATDVDIFANAIKDTTYLEELRDILHKLRSSAETGNTLQSTHHATVRNFLEFGNTQDLIEILKEPLTYGIFLDDFTSNMLLDKLLTSEKYDDAAAVAALVMQQEDYSNSITRALCQYASFKHIISCSPAVSLPTPEPEEKVNKKVEEIKIRIKYLRNPYFDDHFDIKETVLLSGKTLAWMSENNTDNLSHNLLIIGWLYYKKYDKLLALSQTLLKDESFKIYGEVKELLQRKCENVTEDAALQECHKLLSQAKSLDNPIEEALKMSIENAINKCQKQDVAQQSQLFTSWAKIREEKLNEQLKRLDRAKRIQLVQEKQEKLKETEQKLWFFEEEEQLDLIIEEKEKRKGFREDTNTQVQAADSEYIPPEILPKRK